MQMYQYKYLKFVRFKDCVQWDLKRYFNQTIHSKFKISNLGDQIVEEKEKFDISDPKINYRILGVNNQTGIFDAYIENGSRINQKYKKMEVGWIAYNPYRVNIGSIGIKQECHQYDYISPAYVVFSCKQALSPKFLFLTLKTPSYNKVIRDNTTGSVRQNLSFQVLRALPIPLPTLTEQQVLVDAYDATIKAAEEKEHKAEQLNKDIENYLQSELGIKEKQRQTVKGSSYLNFVRFKDINRWDCHNNANKISSNFNIVRLGKLITSMATGTTPPTSNKKYFDGNVKFYTPADISDELYLTESERYISDFAIKDNKARIFHKGDLLFVGIGSTVGKVGVVFDEKVSSNQQITGFSVNPSLATPEYVCYYMCYNKHITTAEQTKSTLPIVNQEKIGNIPIPVPPIVIQNAIVAHISELKEQIQQFKQMAKELREEALRDFEKEIFG